MVDNVVMGAIGDKIAKETLELYEMLGANSQQKNARGSRGIVNEVQVNNGMTA